MQVTTDTCMYSTEWGVNETLVGQRTQTGSKAMCGEGLPHRKQLPLAVSASHPGLTAVRNMRPLQTSVLGKRHRTAHIRSEKLLFHLSPSLAQMYKEERKAFVFARSLIQPQIESLFHTNSLPSSHNHSIITLHFFLLSVC